MPQSITNGWISIHPLNRTWYLYLPKSADASFCTDQRVTIQMNSWKKTLFIRRKRPPSTYITTKVRIRKKNTGIDVGPFLGILTVAGRGSFRGVESNFKEIIETGQKIGAFTFVIPVENIDWDSLNAKGYVYDHHRGRWIKELLPLPHVIYNRIPNRVLEQLPHVTKALQKLSNMKQLKLYNPHFFNKHELFTILQTKKEISQYLPETIPLKSEDVLTNLLCRHSFIYLKPYNGMAGKGIYRLEKTGEVLVLQYQKKEQTIKKEFHSCKEVWNYLQKNNCTDYLAQQGINLATYDGKLFDVRLLLQKNGWGRWGTTGMGIRLAGEGKITTHVPRGGSVESPYDIFPLAFPDGCVDNITKNIRQAALQIAHVLEKEWPALGEVSMDIGVDKSQRIWFIEANAKPGKFDEPHIRRLSLKRTIQYAQYQAKFTRKPGGNRDGNS
ncbi:YheC/YheD family protein [Aneurinibacillus terranovensis]|uniref:YheC/YheD family endospore coat-associated protein n=1 Tax=Aneurinibacillus terranovensis TaxID=278991 RepID=UPI0005577F4E|nr:YheC/YheD family protein [Aneurinibacillus terranovensis]